MRDPAHRTVVYKKVIDMGPYGYRLPKSDVALPGKGDPNGAGAGSRPIHAEGAARNASGAVYSRGRVLIPNLDISRKNALHDHPSSRKI